MVIAVCNNPSTRDAWDEVRKQAAVLGQARSAYLPIIQLTGSVSTLSRRTEFPGYSELTSTIDAHSGERAATMTWVLYDFGLRAAGQEYARQLVVAANQAANSNLQLVFFNTARAYYAVQAGLAMEKAALRAEDLARRSVKITDGLYMAGMVALSSKLQSETALLQATARRVQTHGQMMQSYGDLAASMNLQPDADLEVEPLDEQLDVKPGFRADVRSMIQAASREHPEIASADAQVAAARAQLRAEKASGRPTLTLAATVDRSNTPISTPQQEIFHDRAIGLQVTVPLFDGFLNRYQVHQAEAIVDQSEAQLDETKSQVALQVYKSYQILSTEQGNVEATRLVQASAERALQAATKQYESGYGDLLALLKAEGDVAAADEERIQAIANWSTARLRLAASIGRLGLDDLKTPPQGKQDPGRSEGSQAGSHR